MDPFMQFAFVAAQEALRDSGLRVETEPDRVGIVMGTAMAGVTTVAQTQASFDAGHRVGPRFVPMAIGNIAAAQIAIEMCIRDRAPFPLRFWLCAQCPLRKGRDANCIRANVECKPF